MEELTAKTLGEAKDLISLLQEENSELREASSIFEHMAEELETKIVDLEEKLTLGADELSELKSKLISLESELQEKSSLCEKLELENKSTEQKASELLAQLGQQPIKQADVNVEGSKERKCITFRV